MINVCVNCGQYRVDKTILPDETAGFGLAICPECGYAHRFRRLPLLLISGASGTGKSTACQQLCGALTGAVLLDSDILWRPEFNQPEQNYRGYFETWLRVCKNIAQSGRPVVLFGAGMGVPSNLEGCTERRYLGSTAYLALTCEPGELERRLRSRPAWRNCSDPAYLADHLNFNRWFCEQGSQQQPPVECLDTTGIPPKEVAVQVRDWIEAKLQELQLPTP